MRMVTNNKPTSTSIGANDSHGDGSFIGLFSMRFFRKRKDKKFQFFLPSFVIFP
jgi:hypothetical protein